MVSYTHARTHTHTHTHTCMHAGEGLGNIRHGRTLLQWPLVPAKPAIHPAAGARVQDDARRRQKRRNRLSLQRPRPGTNNTTFATFATFAKGSNTTQCCA